MKNTRKAVLAVLIMLILTAGIYAQADWPLNRNAIEENTQWVPGELRISSVVLDNQGEEVHQSDMHLQFTGANQNSLDLELLRYEENGRDRTRRNRRTIEEEFSSEEILNDGLPFLSEDMEVNSLGNNLFRINYSDEDGDWEALVELDSPSGLPRSMVLDHLSTPYEEEGLLILSTRIEVIYQIGPDGEWYTQSLTIKSALEEPGDGLFRFSGFLEEHWSFTNHYLAG